LSNRMDEFENSIHNCLAGDEELTAISTRFFNILQEEESELLIENFDDEQIFQQIEHLYTKDVLEQEDDFNCLEIESDSETEDAEENEGVPETAEAADVDGDHAFEENEEDEDEEDDDEEGGFSDGDGSDDDLKAALDHFDDDNGKSKEISSKADDDFEALRAQKSEIDDEHFSLAQMEKFCDDMDEKEMEGNLDELDSDLEDELYGDGAGKNDEEDDDDTEENDKAIMFDSFFQSNFEKRQEKLAEEIKKLEDEAVSKKPWHLRGEATAEARHEDELLQMDLDFDAQAAAVAPTAEATETLEAIIIQRIRDMAFDDVERKSRAMIEPAEAKARLVPDEERKSLAQLYENEFLKQGQDTDEDPVRKEIKKDMNDLFAELDFLTYDTTVNQKEIEIKVISDTPALRSEEIGPSLVSTYSSMAPEEIDGKARGVFMDKSERSATDIKRHRRKVKSQIKARKEAGKEVTFKKPKTKSQADLRPVDGQKIKWSNSTKVFKALQDEIDHGTLSKKAATKAKKEKVLEMRKAKSFKL